MTAIRSMCGAVLALGSLLACAGAASAQTPTRIRGSIAAIEGNTATIATREGTAVPVKLADNWAVVMVTPMTLADIKENSFVGVASKKAADGSLEALEVLIFPEAMRGTGEGHYAWDLQPASMMTNATVAQVAGTPDGQSLTVKYKDGTQTIKVKPGTPIVTFVPGDRTDAKVGAKVFVGATKAADGSLNAGRMAVGKDGLTPPM